MEITELQINDWVSIKNGFPMQVVGLYKDVAYLDFEGNEGDMWEEGEKDLCPILITPEILEKNGFKKGATYYKFGDDYSKSIRILECPNGYWYVNIHLGKVNTVFMYIHELQHALRLCKINKEIKL